MMKDEGAAFVDSDTGRGHANAFYRAIPAGDRYLLKLHGKVGSAAERVLLKGKYEAAYGQANDIQFESPTPHPAETTLLADSGEGER